MTPTIRRFICAFPSSCESKADPNGTYKGVSFVLKSVNKLVFLIGRHRVLFAARRPGVAEFRHDWGGFRSEDESSARESEVRRV